MADGNPFQGLLNPNMRQTSLWDLRMMSAANRSETPFERGARGMYRGQGTSGNPMLAGLAGMANEPDYSVFTNDPIAHQRASAMLSQYGLHPLEASEVKQNAVLPNTGFFGNHPRLSGALEGAIFGGLAAHGGETPGDSIQGALEGLVGGQRMRQGMINQQYARPFEAAGMMENLQDMGQRRELQEAQIQHMRAENEKLKRGDHDYRAIGNAGPQDKYIPMYDNTTGTINQVLNPNYNEKYAGRQQKMTDLTEQTREQLRMKGIDPMEATPGQITAANEAAQRQKTALISAGEGAKLPYKNFDEAQRAHLSRMGEYSRKMLAADNPQHQQAATEAILNQRIADSMSGKNKEAASDPNYWVVSDKDRNAYIQQQNAETKAQMDAEDAAFKNQWPQAMEAPPVPKGTSRQTGSGVKTFDPTTGTLH